MNARGLRSSAAASRIARSAVLPLRQSGRRVGGCKGCRDDLAALDNKSRSANATALVPSRRKDQARWRDHALLLSASMSSGAISSARW